MKNIKKLFIVAAILFVLTWFFKPALGFLVVGSLMFYICIQGILIQRRIRKNGITCTGSILEYKSGNNGKKIPIVEFTTLAGEHIKERPFLYASTDLSKIRSYENKIDSEVTLLYDPADPKKFILANENEFNYFVLVFILLISFFFIILSIYILLVAKNG